MLKAFFAMLKVFLDFLKYPLYGILLIILIYIIMCTIFFIYGLFKGKRVQKGEHIRIKQPNLLVKLFILLPQQYVEDIFSRPAEFFSYQGLVIFEGRQGMGKTISMVKFMRDMQLEYPLSKCITNLDYKYEDDKLKDWSMLIDYKNGIKGVIVAMDELQNWFSSNDSRNFPPEMLSVITQNRKNRRIILRYFSKFLSTCKSY